MEFEIALTIVCILVLVIVATAKSALDELSDVSLRLLASDESPAHAAFLRGVIEHHHRFSFTLTFGVHLSIASLAILLTSLAFELHAAHFLAEAFGGMILSVIIFRQIIPLLLVQNGPARTLVVLRYPLRIIYPPLALIAHPLHGALRGLQRRRTEEKQDEEEHGDEQEELQALIDVGEQEGIIEEGEGEMIQSILRFSDRTVGEVMTPRPNIVAIEAESTLDEVRDLMIESKYSRLPVYRDHIDNIEGVIYVRDLLAFWRDGASDRKAMQLMRPSFFVPETKATDDLLREMQKAKAQMVFVIDEYGGLAGIVTLEDLIEEIVGEIEDEDEPEPHEGEAEIVEDGAGAWIVRGQVEVGKIERLLGVELAADDFTTIAGLVINQIGHLPAAGETLEFHGLRFDVLQSDERRVERVRIERISGENAQEAEVAEKAEGR